MLKYNKPHVERVLLKKEASDYVSYGRVTCDPKYQIIEQNLFKNSLVKNVYVGGNLDVLSPHCPS